MDGLLIETLSYLVRKVDPKRGISYVIKKLIVQPFILALRIKSDPL